MSKDIQVLLDELNFSIGRIDEQEKDGFKLNQYICGYRQGLKVAKDLAQKIGDE